MGITYIDDSTAILEHRDYSRAKEQENTVYPDIDELTELCQRNREYVWSIKSNENEFTCEIHIEPIIIEEHLLNLIFNKMYFPESWKAKGVAPPNITAKFMAFDICDSLFKDYGIIPYIVTPTIEEGVYIEYDKNGEIALEIEVFNDLDVVAIVSNYKTKQMLYSEEIKGLNFSNVIIRF